MSWVDVAIAAALTTGFQVLWLRRRVRAYEKKLRHALGTELLACLRSPAPWTEGCGADLPRDTLAWVEHPKYGVVWAVKESYIDMPGSDDHDSEEQEIFTWCAYAAGDAFELQEVTRYIVIEKPEPRQS